jgi:hypothetical protein
MGLFSKSHSVPPAKDLIWKSRQACMKGLAALGLSALKDGECPIVVSFFEEAHKTIASFMESAGVPISNLLTGSPEMQPRTILVIPVTSVQNLKGDSKNEKVIFLFFGHYPLIQKEQQLLDTISLKMPKSKRVFCLSLEDPLFETFGGRNLIKVVESLGLGDDDCIEHAMVSKAVSRAREKLSEKMTGT